MASFPGAKVHRVNRRRLGRHQFPAAPPAVVTVVTTSPGVVQNVEFSVPVVIGGLIPLSTDSGAVPVSQVVVDNQHVAVSFNTAVTSGALVSLAANVPEIATFQGGGNTAASSTVAG